MVLRFCLGFRLSFHFSKNLLTEMFFSKCYHVEERKQPANFHDKTSDNRDPANTRTHGFVLSQLSLIRLYCDINTQNKLYFKVLNTIHEILAGVLNGFRRVGLRRRHCTQPFEVTCVGLGTECLTLYDHSVSSSHLVRPWIFWRLVCALEACSWF